MGPGGGLLVMSPIIQVLLNNISWRMTFMSLAGIVFLTCLFSCSFDPNVNSTVPASNEYQDTEGRRKPCLNTCASLEFSYLKNKKYFVYLIASSMLFSGIAIPTVHLGRYCEELGIDANHVARMFFFNGLATAIFRAFTGYLCDVKRQYRIWILRFTVFVSGVIVLLMTVWTTYKQLLACFIAYGVMDGALSSSINVLVLSTLSLKQKSQGFGFFHLCVATNLAAGPALAGFIADLFGSYSPAFYVAGSVQILASGLLFLTHCFKDDEQAAHSEAERAEDLLIVERITVL